jgi:hypothetical protein
MLNAPTNVCFCGESGAIAAVQVRCRRACNHPKTGALLTSSAQTPPGATVTRYRPKTYQTRGKHVIQAVMDIAPLIIAGLVVAFLFISALTD